MKLPISKQNVLNTLESSQTNVLFVRPLDQNRVHFYLAARTTGQTKPKGHTDMTTPNPLVTQLEAEIAKLTDIDAGISASAGTMAKILKDAEEVVSAQAVVTSLASSDNDKADTLKSIGDQVVNLSKSFKSATWANLVDQTSTLAEQVSTAFKAAVVSQAGDAQKLAQSGTEALVASREAAASMANALKLVLAGQGVDTEHLVIPEAPNKRARSTSSTGQLGKHKGLCFYRVNDDGTEFMRAVPHCNRLGSIAWFEFGVPAKTLKVALPADFAKGFEPIKVTLGGVTRTLGARVIDVDNGADVESTEDSTEEAPDSTE